MSGPGDGKKRDHRYRISFQPGSLGGNSCLVDSHLEHRAPPGVVRLVSEGLANKDVAARLFISPRTVQAHLTHVYTKLGLTSRVQLDQEAARRG
ncbi:MAG: helix-turn-helix transcriptional regulator [Mycobacterium sp.]